MTTSRVITLKTGERCRMFVRVSWQKIYYSLDHETSWHPTKAAALSAARESGLLAVIGKPVTLLSGEVAIAR